MVNMGTTLLGLDIGAFIAGKILVICVFMAATFSRHLNLRTASKAAVQARRVSVMQQRAWMGIWKGGRAWVITARDT